MPLAEQMAAFAWTVAIGMLAGLCYEIYRVIRDILKPGKVGTFTGDLVFWFFLTVISFVLLIKANYGQLRLYVFIGLFLGAFLFVRVLGDFSRRLVKSAFYLAGRFFRLGGLVLHYLWLGVAFPFRIVFVAAAFPLRLAGRLLGLAGRYACRKAGRPLNPVKTKIAFWAEKLLKKLTPPR
ncbi:MAG: spore cortex biosynthesis protein YabQ [Peptococcaceae bacterium]|nr:spore cortex biosynthesis protein YabQ [Peptococcaceae bacterium]